MELLFATNNRHKLREILEIAGESHVILSLSDVNLEGDIPETSDTLEGNAIQKARFVHERTGRDCFADDTGLEIDALAGRPGVYSARYAGEGCTFEDNVRKVLAEMKGKETRTARFRCVVCLILKGKEYIFEGRVEGVILEKPEGDGGFGYDPVFRPDGSTISFAVMAPADKNRISHRGRAVTAMMAFLEKK
jgi:XTP/dITP diphosphohydrolase